MYFKRLVHPKMKIQLLITINVTINYTEQEFTDKPCNIAFMIEGDSSAIINSICPSLSVNYGSVY